MANQKARRSVQFNVQAPTSARGIKVTKLIPVDKIIPNEENHTDPVFLERITENIKDVGVLEEIKVMQNPEQPGYFDLLSGHHRFFAAKQLGISELEATIEPYDKKKAVGIFSRANELRRDIGPIERARNIERMMLHGIHDDHSATQEETAKCFSISVQDVQRHLALLELPEQYQIMVTNGWIPWTGAAELASLNRQALDELYAYLLQKGHIQERLLDPENDKPIPRKLLRETAAVLKSGGHLVEDIPDVESQQESPASAEADPALIRRELKKSLKRACNCCNVDYKGFSPSVMTKKERATVMQQITALKSYLDGLERLFEGPTT